MTEEGKKKKQRLDVCLVQAGWVKSREKAAALIMSHQVLIDDVPATKPGMPVDPLKMKIRIREGALDPYVSRGAKKLLKAKDYFSLDFNAKNCVDLGASTGGFTQVLLESGAAHVTCVDVGHGQLHESLRQNPKVKLFEGVNARSVRLEDIGGNAFDSIVGDLSFISLLKILPAAALLGTPTAEWVFLIKPQFEVGREFIEKGGIVKDERAKEEAVQRVIDGGVALGLKFCGLTDSPILGADGNHEYLVYFRRGKET